MDRGGAAGFLKRFALRLVHARVAISRSIAGKIRSDLVIPNPYRDDLFRPDERKDRKGDILFVGRLVSDKGCDLLLDAVTTLASQGFHPLVSIVGSGPAERELRDQVSRLGLGALVRWKGALHGEDLAREYGAHRILAVPSRWEEPFGIVALEAIACGCRVLVPDAADSRRLRAPAGDFSGPAMRDRSPRPCCPNLPGSTRDHESGKEHLQRHRPVTVAGEYLALFGQLLERP